MGGDIDWSARAREWAQTQQSEQPAWNSQQQGEWANNHAQPMQWGQQQQWHPSHAEQSHYYHQGGPGFQQQGHWQQSSHADGHAYGGAGYNGDERGYDRPMQYHRAHPHDQHHPHGGDFDGPWRDGAPAEGRGNEYSRERPHHHPSQHHSRQQGGFEGPWRDGRPGAEGGDENYRPRERFPPTHPHNNRHDDDHDDPRDRLPADSHPRGGRQHPDERQMRFEEERQMRFEEERQMRFEEERQMRFEEERQMRFEEEQQMRFEEEQQMRFEEEQQMRFEDEQQMRFEDEQQMRFEQEQRMRFEGEDPHFTHGHPGERYDGAQFAHLDNRRPNDDHGDPRRWQEGPSHEFRRDYDETDEHHNVHHRMPRDGQGELFSGERRDVVASTQPNVGAPESGPFSSAPPIHLTAIANEVGAQQSEKLKTAVPSWMHKKLASGPEKAAQQSPTEKAKTPDAKGESTGLKAFLERDIPTSAAKRKKGVPACRFVDDSDSEESDSEAASKARAPTDDADGSGKRRRVEGADESAVVDMEIGVEEWRAAYPLLLKAAMTIVLVECSDAAISSVAHEAVDEVQETAAAADEDNPSGLVEYASGDEEA